MGGIQLLKKIKMYDSSIEVIILTAYGEVDSYLEAMNIGAFEYLNKPPSMDNLKKVMLKALSND
jgi:two-component system response regulator (stage 0 sporulation protein F)